MPGGLGGVFVGVDDLDVGELLDILCELVEHVAVEFEGEPALASGRERLEVRGSDYGRRVPDLLGECVSVEDEHADRDPITNIDRQNSFIFLFIIYTSSTIGRCIVN